MMARPPDGFVAPPELLARPAEPLPAAVAVSQQITRPQEPATPPRRPLVLRYGVPDVN